MLVSLDEEVLAYLESPEVERANYNTAISYNTDNPKQELFKMLMNKYKYLLPEYRKLSSLKNEDLARRLGSVSNIKGDDLNNLPKNSIILVETKDGD